MRFYVEKYKNHVSARNEKLGEVHINIENKEAGSCLSYFSLQIQFGITSENDNIKLQKVIKKKVLLII